MKKIDAYQASNAAENHDFFLDWKSPFHTWKGAQRFLYELEHCCAWACEPKDVHDLANEIIDICMDKSPILIFLATLIVMMGNADQVSLSVVKGTTEEGHSKLGPIQDHAAIYGIFIDAVIQAMERYGSSALAEKMLLDGPGASFYDIPETDEDKALKDRSYDEMNERCRKSFEEEGEEVL